MINLCFLLLVSVDRCRGWGVFFQFVIAKVYISAKEEDRACCFNVKVHASFCVFFYAI